MPSGCRRRPHFRRQSCVCSRRYGERGAGRCKPLVFGHVVDGDCVLVVCRVLVALSGDFDHSGASTSTENCSACVRCCAVSSASRAADGFVLRVFRSGFGRPVPGVLAPDVFQNTRIYLSSALSVSSCSSDMESDLVNGVVYIAARANMTAPPASITPTPRNVMLSPIVSLTGRITIGDRN